MKLKAATLRNFTALHSWTGLLAGLALFVAFYAGAITVFHPQLQRWAGAAAGAPYSLEDMQRLLDGVLARHPEARQHVGMTFPGYELAEPTAYWQDASGTWLFATPHDLAGSSTPPGATLPELVNELHYTLGIPFVGTWLMGVVALLYGLALVSGLVIHLPQLARDVFALRRGHNLKRWWQDAHNVIGVLSLPFHLVFAVTGALLCLLFVLMTALGPLAFQDRLMAASAAAMDTARPIAPAGREATLSPVAKWHARAIEAARERGVADFEPGYLKLAHAGDAHAVVEITGSSPRALGAGAVALDATGGAVLSAQLPGRRDANHATLAAVYALHFGDYGNVVVQWLYFLLGLGGAFLFYSGNLLWIESRRRRRQVAQGRGPVFMARATAGVCLGACVAVSVAFVAAQLGPLLASSPAWGERTACFASWLLCMAWAAWRPPARAARELLWLAAAVTALVPVCHGLATGAWPWRAIARGEGALALIDLVALALAVGFAVLARATARRARSGDTHSVWADPAAG
ncbi:PepSY-associated TM helix domain-containing protein [Frateuria hangzhouensis]|uniref:PepSY-associated TM helix domain-containing protein n=1 Tax=Frateuria hangzhouensis TaxID=2995589 RepID=UPI002260C856|nr:PepSY-associated TM helix domain-containing protein [Frateuria sp. STR12]MCX7515386.1 PepSY-associated TM helix domain-containing protein [Frateuria sp. STR12]